MIIPKKILYAVAAVFFIPLFVYPELYRGVFIQSAEAAMVTNGVSQPFSISKDYEFSGKSKINATLKVEGQKAKYFVEDDYWNSRGSFEQQEILQQISRLADEFDSIQLADELKDTDESEMATVPETNEQEAA